VSLPVPEPGLVIRYSYLWRSEYLEGREEGIKDRPCAIVVTAITHDGESVVTVLPVTHSPPAQPALALEIPSITKRRLGLDSQRSWIVFSESNRFVWPGPDLRSLHGGDLSTVAYGILPPNFFNALRDRYLAAINAYQSATVPRTE
jgi:hypothetical protein